MSRFNNKIEFGRYPDPDEHTKEIWKIEDFPHIVGFKNYSDTTKELGRMDYSKNFSFEKIYYFLNQICLL